MVCLEIDFVWVLDRSVKVGDELEDVSCHPVAGGCLDVFANLSFRFPEADLLGFGDVGS